MKTVTIKTYFLKNILYFKQEERILQKLIWKKKLPTGISLGKFISIKAIVEYTQVLNINAHTQTHIHAYNLLY